MSGKNAIFVDVDSLNVMYKWGDKMVAALNYGQSVQRLSEMPPALGAGYDIYLCIKPRAEGEGNVVIEELSIPGMPFTADGEELYQLLKFFRSYNGFGEVYLCNWVANFIAMARVGTFKSAVYYGDRVAMMTVSNSVLQDFKFYASQRAFIDEVGENPDIYGDLGLLDVDGLRARYPELAGASKAQLTAVAPLVQCYRTPTKMETSEYYEWLKQAHSSGEFTREIPMPERKEPDPEPTAPIEPVEELPTPVAPPVKKKTIRGKAPIGAKIFVALGCIIALVLGGVTGVIVKEPPVTSNEAYYAEVDERINKLRSLTSVYSSAGEVMPTVQEALEYFQQFEAELNIVGFEYLDENYVVRCLVANEEDVDNFTEYVGDKYIIVSTNDLGQSDNSGELAYHFSVMFTAN